MAGRGTSRLGVVLLLLAGCSGGAEEDAGIDSSMPDTGVACVRASDCDDGVFCNGEETCGAAGVCLAGAAPCPSMGECDEAGDRCAACGNPDMDGDDHDRIECGGDDCDDGNASRYPGAVEICDGADLDEDCDASTFGELDADGDGETSSACCNGDNCGPDCNDADARVGLPFEICDTQDNDCDGNVDETTVDQSWYPDLDGDGFGDADGTVVSSCSPVAEHSVLATDCDDGDRAVSPVGVERCNGRDDDCDSAVDESCIPIADAGPVDAGPMDAGPMDAGPVDAGPLDAGPPDAGACPDGFDTCAGGGMCATPIDTRTHCGGCTTACGSGEACVARACVPTRLEAIHPSIAEAGAHIALEGTFADDVRVLFPGVSTSVVPERAGAHRVVVAVPAGATAGPLRVQSGGTSTNGQPFWRTSFTLGVGQFRHRFEQDCVTRETPRLGTARSNLALVSTGGFVVAAGGRAAAPSDVVEQARIHADGAFAPWEAAGSLGTARQDAAAIRVGTSIYVAGGRAESGPLDSIEVAPVLSDGRVGAFVPATISLRSARERFSLIHVGNYVYAIGGGSSVERAEVRPDGSLGDFAVHGAGLSTSRYEPAVLVVEDRLWVIGGYMDTSGGGLRTVDLATLDGDGGLGPFALSPENLILPRANPGAAVLGGAVHVYGGEDEGDLPATVETVTVGADGAPAGGVVSTASRAVPAGARHLRLRGHLYAIGGRLGGEPHGGLLRASVNISGALGARSPGTELDAPRSGPRAMILGDFLYLLGGTGGGPAPVQRAAIQPDGQLGAWTTLAASVGYVRSTAAQIGDSVVVAGGTTTMPVSQVWVGAIATDGSLGPFTAGDSLTDTWSSHYAAVLERNLFHLGGATGGSGMQSWQRYVRSGTGLALQGFGTVDNPRLAPSGVVLDDTIHLIGGENSGGFARGFGSGVVPETLNPSSWGCCSPQMATGRSNHVAFVVGDALFVAGGTVDTAANTTDSIERASILGADVGGFAAAGVSLSSGRYGMACAVVGNHAYLLGGYRDAPSATVDVFELN